MFQTLQARIAASAVALLVGLALLAPAGATTLVPSQTYRAGTRIACVLDESLSSQTAKYGDKFKLRIVDPAHPALQGGHITGWVTEVRQPSGLSRAMVTFFLTTIHLANGEKKSITAFVVSRRVTQYNPAAVQAARQQMAVSPPMPNGVTTPGPVAWQAKIGSSGPVKISTRPSGTVGGTIWAQAPNEQIVIPAGQAVTVELQQNLTIP